jgi:hypothetical protein
MLMFLLICYINNRNISSQGTGLLAAAASVVVVVVVHLLMVVILESLVKLRLD